MRQIFAAGLAGLLFALGLGVSGMTRPDKVIGFLDLFGSWDASLAFVMVGAIGVYLLAIRAARRRGAPVLAPSFQLPTRTDIDRRLLLGAAIFGVGWGLAGYCPGPALVSLVTGRASAWIFVGSMLVGMGLFSWVDARLRRPSASP